jgi:hypothetical protein
MRAYGARGSASDYEYDHFVPLELGGATNDPRNLWPEPGASPNPKDAVEDELNRAVCEGRMTLAQAQRAIASNWIALARMPPPASPKHGANLAEWDIWQTARMHRPCAAAALLATISLAVASAPATGSTPPARAASSCSVSHGGEGYGPTYLLSLSVTGTSCSKGLAVVRSYHACQLKRGGVKGKCTTAVEGFRCTEKRGPSIPTEFFSSVSCAAGSARVDYKYSQFT